MPYLPHKCVISVKINLLCAHRKQNELHNQFILCKITPPKATVLTKPYYLRLYAVSQRYIETQTTKQ